MQKTMMAKKKRGLIGNGAVMAFIVASYTKKGYMPSRAEIAEEFSRTPPWAQDQVDQLVAAGKLKRGAGRTRNLLLV